MVTGPALSKIRLAISGPSQNHKEDVSPEEIEKRYAAVMAMGNA